MPGNDGGMTFEVIETAEALQSARMVLEPGEASGPKRNEHAGSEQFLVLLEGTLEAEIGEERRTMHAGESVIVPKGAPHRFTNTGDRPAVTLNTYAPPAY